MNDAFQINPVGTIIKQDTTVKIKIENKYREALLGLDQFSHMNFLYWFHKNDSPGNRNCLQVHPRRNPKNPLTGVFATHSPKRPNLIAISLCRILSIRGNSIQIDEIDAFDGTPVIDIKCYIPGDEEITGIRTPAWVNNRT